MSEHESHRNPAVEKAIEPDLPICDPHHHLWRHTNESYLIEDFSRDISGGHNIVKTVSVEAFALYVLRGPEDMTPLGETEFIVAETSRAKSQTELAAGIVGFADLTLGSKIAPILESQITASKNRFRGVRFNTVWDATPILPTPQITAHMLADSKIREGIATLHKYGLNYDAWVYHPQLKELADLAKALPDIPIILGHIGTPLGVGPYANKRAEVFQEWKRGIESLVECPNIYLKIGGFGMRICGFGWHERTIPPSSTEVANVIAPYVYLCIDKLGVKRCMFESNFPEDKIAFPYTIIWNAYKGITKDFSVTERRALFHDTAISVYRI